MPHVARVRAEIRAAVQGNSKGAAPAAPTPAAARGGLPRPTDLNAVLRDATACVAAAVAVPAPWKPLLAARQASNMLLLALKASRGSIFPKSKGMEDWQFQVITGNFKLKLKLLLFSRACVCVNR